MPIFFQSTPPPASQQREMESILTHALGSDKIVDASERRVEAQRLLAELRPPPKPPIIWSRVFLASLILVLFFLAAMWLANDPKYTKLSESLLRCFELLFTATIGLLGIEAAKRG